MVPVGHGIDLVEVERVSRLIDRHGERALARLFTETERAHAEAAGRRRMERYAGRFAGKEAILKALGTGLIGGIAWTDIEIRADRLGGPVAELSGKARTLEIERGIEYWLVSITHTETLAQASAIAVGHPRPM
ncbi:MAG: holo-ACP synthase [Planctomycetota bacterium]